MLNYDKYKDTITLPAFEVMKMMADYRELKQRATKIKKAKAKIKPTEAEQRITYLEKKLRERETNLKGALAGRTKAERELKLKTDALDSALDRIRKYKRNVERLKTIIKKQRDAIDLITKEFEEFKKIAYIPLAEPKPVMNGNSMATRVASLELIPLDKLARDAIEQRKSDPALTTQSTKKPPGKKKPKANNRFDDSKSLEKNKPERSYYERSSRSPVKRPIIKKMDFLGA